MTRINSHQVIQMIDDVTLVMVDERTGVELTLPLAQAASNVARLHEQRDQFDGFGFHDGDNDNPGKTRIYFDVEHLDAVRKAVDYFVEASRVPLSEQLEQVAVTPITNIEEFLTKAAEVGTRPSVGEDPFVLDRFYVTFGVQHGPNEETHIKHPVSPELSGKGYVVIEATDYESARAIAFGVFGKSWAFIYPSVEFNNKDTDRFYPAGELGRVTVNIPIAREP